MVKWIVLIVLLALVVFIIVQNIRKRGARRYLYGLLVGIDQFANAFLGGAPDETISSRCARGQVHWYWRILGQLLELVDPGHLKQAQESEINGAHRA